MLKSGRLQTCVKSWTRQGSRLALKISKGTRLWRHIQLLSTFRDSMRPNRSNTNTSPAVLNCPWRSRQLNKSGNQRRLLWRVQSISKRASKQNLIMIRFCLGLPSQKSLGSASKRKRERWQDSQVFQMLIKLPPQRPKPFTKLHQLIPALSMKKKPSPNLNLQQSGPKLLPSSRLLLLERLAPLNKAANPNCRTQTHWLWRRLPLSRMTLN